jgi:hypothetical protein
MALDWRFYTQQPTDPIRNPIAGEFFSTEAVGNVAEALVREGIQNTLDARLRKNDGKREKAHVRIYVSGLEGALPSDRAKRWFKNLWPHILAKGNGLREQPRLEGKCSFIVFEDFGTTGLEGDPAAHLVADGVSNHFLNFFRAEGHSDKGAEDRGSWGVGKTVFPRSSQISTFIGLTVRSSDQKQFLLGRSILKYHRLGLQAFKSDGYFGMPREDGLMLPADDKATIAEFKKDFGVQRVEQSGLSIVIPWYDIEGEDTLTWKSIATAVLTGFFYPILMGHLGVTIQSPTATISLSGDTLLKEVGGLEKTLGITILPLIELALWAQTRTENEFVSLSSPDSAGAQQWLPDLIPSDVVAKVRTAIASRQRIALRVPMTVQPKSEAPKQTYFNVFLEYCDEESQRPVFIRDELIISDVKSPRTSQTRALVIVEHSHLANLLRDAETPAHTQWNADTGNFKNKYKYGPGAIKFVRQSVSEILRIVNQAEQEPDPTITIDYFSIPAEPEDQDAIEGRQRRSRKDPGDGPAQVPSLPPSPPRAFGIITLNGGFAIRGVSNDVPLPKFVDVSVAYDIRRGSPLRKYSNADFDLAKAPIMVAAESGVSIVNATGNRLRLAPTQGNFNLEVKGFDPNRDLYVKAVGMAGEDDDAS